MEILMTYIPSYMSRFSFSPSVQSCLSNAKAYRTDLVCTCRDCAAFSDITDPNLGTRSNVHDVLPEGDVTGGVRSFNLLT